MATIPGDYFEIVDQIAFDGSGLTIPDPGMGKNSGQLTNGNYWFKQIEFNSFVELIALVGLVNSGSVVRYSAVEFRDQITASEE